MLIALLRLGLYSTFETSPPYRMVAAQRAKPIVPEWHVRMDRKGKLEEVREHKAKDTVQWEISHADE